MKLHSLSQVRQSKDFYSAMIRFHLGLFIALYVWLGMSNGDFELSYYKYNTFASFFFIITVLIGIDVFRNPDCRIRRFITLFFDMTCNTYIITLTGWGSSEFILIYIWLYIAYGTRYGSIYLFTAVALVVIEYNVILIIDNRWTGNTLTSFAQMFVLITLPLYLHSMLRQLRDAKKIAELATRAKSNFLATMSHEIRTPMSGIIGVVYLLQGTNPDKQQKEYIKALLDASKSLHSLIDDILDFSKIEANKLHLQKSAFNLRHTINEVISILSPNAEYHSLELIVSLDPKLPSYVIGDCQRIKQVLLNLLSNAIKFTDKGAVVLKLTKIEKKNLAPDPKLENKIKIRFDVIDTGIGISREQQTHIFDSFTQVNKLRINNSRGTGLGTTISKQLVECMGGDIGLSSTLGAGSHFWFTLTLSMESTCEHEQSHSKSTKLKDVSLSILIAEDEDVNAMVLSHFLKNSGHTTQRVKNGSEAIKELNNNHYDLVFMDMHMPIMNGVQATMKWRENEPESSHLPIIALTANATKEDQKYCLDAGMDDFITKPITPERLSSAITKLYSFPNTEL